MNLVEITEVAIERPDSLKAMSVQAPQPGSKRESHDLKVAGWLVGAEREVIAIDLVHRGEVLRSAPVAGPRQDVADLHPDLPWAATSGFWTLVGLVGLPSNFELEMVARFDGGSDVRVATIRGRRLPVTTSYSPVLRPLIVTSIGRTGTTWLMRLLVEHPHIIGVARYPYETRIARYWAHALHVLAQPANHEESSHPARFHQNRYMAGHNPFYMSRLTEEHAMGEWFGRVYIERLATFFQETIDSFYAELGRIQQRSGAKWFAEKNLPDYVPPVMWELYPDAREIILVRDFRDMAASMIAFGNKRGRPFGPVSYASDEEFVTSLRRGALKLQAAWENRRDRALLVRYEDLVTDPRATLRKVLHYLDEDASEAVERMVTAAEADQSALARHRTASDTASSIGRWRSDFGEALTAVCAAAFDDILPTFGYPPTRRTAS